MRNPIPIGTRPRRPTPALIWWCLALGVFECALVLLTSSFQNDHFMHVAMGQQILQGRLPVRDYLDPGMPLMEIVSALSQLVFGYRLLSEGIVAAVALGLAHAVTLWLCATLTGSLTAALIVVAPQVMMDPRTYGYPKLVLYAVGILCLWRYLEHPRWPARVTLASLVAMAFLMRHDHGLYLGLAACAAAWFARPRVAIQARLSETARLVGLIAIAVLPYVVWVQVQGGISNYVTETLSFVKAENALIGHFFLPPWPLRRVGDVVAIDDPQARNGHLIAIRWEERATEQERQRIVRIYGLVPEGDRYRIHDARVETIRSLIGEPSIADTAGIDRSRARLESKRPASDAVKWEIFRGLQRPFEAASAIVWAFTFLPLATAGLVVAGLVPRELRVTAALVVVLALLTVIGFIRSPIETRVADAAVPQTVLMAICLATVLAVPRLMGLRRVLFTAVVVVALLAFGTVAQAAWVVGRVPERLQQMGVGLPVSEIPRIWSARLEKFITSPPVDGWYTTNSEVPRYVLQCTKDDDRLLVMWFAPEIYYYSNRTFAGRHPFFLKGFWNAPSEVDALVSDLLTDRPSIVLVDASGFPSGFDAVQAWLMPRYRSAGVVKPGKTPITIYVRLDLVPVRTYTPLALPCFR